TSVGTLNDRRARRSSLANPRLGSWQVAQEASSWPVSQRGSKNSRRPSSHLPRVGGLVAGMYARGSSSPSGTLMRTGSGSAPTPPSQPLQADRPDALVRSGIVPVELEFLPLLRLSAVVNELDADILAFRIASRIHPGDVLGQGLDRFGRLGLGGLFLFEFGLL